MGQVVFTMDVEDWWHAANIEPFISQLNRVNSSVPLTHKVLDILDKKNVRGTFFTLGVIAERYPDLIRKISDMGHEIASHGWDHKPIISMSRDELKLDIEKSKEKLEKISGGNVIGYRSPCFGQNKHLEEILLSLGFKYSSISIQSTLHNRYRNNIFSPKQIFDFPLPTAKIFGLKLPATGGGWFRLFPLHFQKFLLGQCSEKYKVFYCHPWDFDLQQKTLGPLPKAVSWRHSVNSDKALVKLEKIEFSPRPLAELLELENERH